MSEYTTEIEKLEADPNVTGVVTKFSGNPYYGKQHNSYLETKDGTHMHIFADPKTNREGFHGENVKTHHNHPVQNNEDTAKGSKSVSKEEYEKMKGDFKETIGYEKLDSANKAYIDANIDRLMSEKGIEVHQEAVNTVEPGKENEVLPQAKEQETENKEEETQEKEEAVTQEKETVNANESVEDTGKTENLENMQEETLTQETISVETAPVTEEMETVTVTEETIEVEGNGMEEGLMIGEEEGIISEAIDDGIGSVSEEGGGSVESAEEGGGGIDDSPGGGSGMEMDP